MMRRICGLMQGVAQPRQDVEVRADRMGDDGEDGVDRLAVEGVEVDGLLEKTERQDGLA